MRITQEELTDMLTKYEHESKWYTRFAIIQAVLGILLVVLCFVVPQYIPVWGAMTIINATLSGVVIFVAISKYKKAKTVREFIEEMARMVNNEESDK